MRWRWPQLQPRDEFIGLFDPLGGYSEPHEYIPALATKIRELGVDIREHRKVTGFLVRHGHVAGVQTMDGDVEGDAVVCTVHAWTLKVLEPLGLRLPMKSFVHQRYVTRPLSEPVDIPVVNAHPLGGYIRPAHGGRLLAGVETPERLEYRVVTTDFRMTAVSAPPGLREQMTRDFAPCAPILARVSWEEERVGLIAFSMDGEPILGPVGRLPGFYVGCAFHSGGFAYNPVVGMLLADLVADGRTSIDVRVFSPDRFEAWRVDEHLATRVAQKDAFHRRH